MSAERIGKLSANRFWQSGGREVTKEWSEAQPSHVRSGALDELPAPGEYLRDGSPTERLVGQFMTGLGMGLGFKKRGSPLDCEALYIIGAVAAIGPIEYDSLRRIVWRNIRDASALHTFDVAFTALRMQRWFAKNRRGAFVLSKTGRSRLQATIRNFAADLNIYERHKQEAAKGSRKTKSC